MDVVSIIGAIGAVLVTPVVGVVILLINKKFDSLVSELKFRLAMCEARHDARDRGEQPPKQEPPKPVPSIN